MSSRRFAAITASLLARKGEAMPSVVRDAPKAPILWSSDPSVPPSRQHPLSQTGEFEAERAILRNGHVQESDSDHTNEHEPEQDAGDLSHFSDPSERRAPTPQSGERRHRISLAISLQEHERLGIVAVKKGLTRHQLVRDALDFYFEKLASEYRTDCACIATGGCENGCETS